VAAGTQTAGDRAGAIGVVVELWIVYGLLDTGVSYSHGTGCPPDQTVTNLRRMGDHHHHGLSVGGRRPGMVGGRDPGLLPVASALIIGVWLRNRHRRESAPQT
jgi:hypothetical protein